MNTPRSLAIVAIPVSLIVFTSLSVSSTKQVTVQPQELVPRLVACCDSRTPISSLPYTISTGGSYYLTGSLAATGGSTGVTVNADNVTIDLNGFTLQGSSGSGSGIDMPGAGRNITIFNGTVAGFPGGGIDGTTVKNCNIAGVHLSQLGGAAVVVGAGSIVEDCNATSCDSGFLLPDTATIRDCIANSINGDAFLLGYMSVATRCVVNGSGGVGIHLLGYGIQVRECVLRDCTVGILLDETSYSHVVHNVCAAHSQAAIRNISPSHHNRIEGNHVSASAVGLDIDTATQPNVIVRNSVAGGTAYSIGSGNDVGPIGTAASSTSPWANFQN